MALKWGSTTVTAVKWGSTQCSIVYWGSTIVFPGGGGVVAYNGSSFAAPLNQGLICYRYSTSETYKIVTSGTLKTSVIVATTSGTISGNIMSVGGSSSIYLRYYLDLSSYTRCTVEYTSTNINYAKLGSLKIKPSNVSTSTYATELDSVSNSYKTYDISAVSSRSSIEFTLYTSHIGYSGGTSTAHTVTIKRIIFS